MRDTRCHFSLSLINPYLVEYAPLAACDALQWLVCTQYRREEVTQSQFLEFSQF